MRIKKYKIFMDFEKEEAWLNKMAGLGFHFVEYKFGRYYFEKGVPGAYIYRLEMLDDYPTDEKSAEYIAFLKEQHIEMVTSYHTWAYFRKKAEDGSFEIYTDIPSRMKHYEKVARIFGIVLLINFAIGCINVNINNINIYLSVVNFLIAIILFIQYVKIGLKVKHLKQEKELFDR